MKLMLALIAAVAIASGFAVSASADGPVAGTTFSTQCSFGHGQASDPGTTQCSQTIVVIIDRNCWAAESGMRLWEEDDIASVRSYRGNAVQPGLNGVTVDADYSALVKPHANQLSDSGPHAFSSTFPVPDSTCP
jgi:hypothetical protein